MLPATALNSQNMPRDKTRNYDLYEDADSSDSEAKALEAYNARMNDLLDGKVEEEQTLVYKGPTKALQHLSQD